VAVASAGLYASLHLIPDNHDNIPPLSFLQAGCSSCRPTNSIKALKAQDISPLNFHPSLVPEGNTWGDEARVVSTGAFFRSLNQQCQSSEQNSENRP